MTRRRRPFTVAFSCGSFIGEYLLGRVTVDAEHTAFNLPVDFPEAMPPTGRTLYITAEAGEGTLAFRVAVLPGNFRIDHDQVLPLPMFSDVGRGFSLWARRFLAVEWLKTGTRCAIICLQTVNTCQYFFPGCMTAHRKIILNYGFSYKSGFIPRRKGETIMTRA